jgi:hypothetical protein
VIPLSPDTPVLAVVDRWDATPYNPGQRIVGHLQPSLIRHGAQGIVQTRFRPHIVRT